MASETTPRRLAGPSALSGSDSGVKVIQKLADGLYVIRYINGERAMWTLRALRKGCSCAATRLPLAKGEEHYSPIGNMRYRGNRLARSFVES